MNAEHVEELYRVICRITSPEDCKAFFEDLCTYKEIEQMSERLNAAKLLMAGKTYDEIIAKADISSATLSRVSKCVKYADGYNRVLGSKKEQTEQK